MSSIKFYRSNSTETTHHKDFLDFYQKHNLQDEYWSIEEVQTWLKNPRSHLVIVHNNNLTTAFAMIQDNIDHVDLFYLFVDPFFRKQGIASLLMNELINHPLRDDCRKIVLEVRQQNLAAIHLYEHLGFKKVRIVPHYYSDGESAIIMELDR